MASTNDTAGWPLPAYVTEDWVDCTESCGLKFHILKAGIPTHPLILFCHGFPELSFTWRNILPTIANAGYYCIAMDQRGYGRTTGWDTRRFQELDMSEWTLTNLVRDVTCLTYKLGYTEVACIVGHDYGASVSAAAALIRPDVFKATVQMSNPYSRPPRPGFGNTPPTAKLDNIQAELAKLESPRKHYQWYNGSSSAAADWINPPQGLEVFLRGYVHLKSADWDQNKPFPLGNWSASNLAKLPEYYVLLAQDTMPETVEKLMSGEDIHKTESWLSPQDLGVYITEWKRTGFQGSLNWYRMQRQAATLGSKDMYLYAGARLEVPCTFISGKQDWGNYQSPGSLESYDDDKVVKAGCFRGVKFIEHAGHWVQQEQPQALCKELLSFLDSL